MTHEQLMEWAKDEISDVLRGQSNRLMNVVERAYAEGKKNAEIEKVTEIASEALKRASVGGGKNG
jgi:hypothetical protein